MGKPPETTTYVVDVESFFIDVRDGEDPYEVAKQHIKSDIFHVQIDRIEEFEDE